jgi:acetyl esterase/lipase
MRKPVLQALLLQILTTGIALAQEVIPLPLPTPAGAASENYPEKEYFSKAWNTEIVANVTKPSLLVFKPSTEVKNGTAVVICPGGGFMALSIASEGTEVAQFLAAKGVTVFVLKYRLAKSGDDAGREFNDLVQNRPKLEATLKKQTPLSFADGMEAMTYVHRHAAEWGVSPDRIGIMGFSAGGAVTTSVAFHYTLESRPAFIAPIYEGGYPLKNAVVPADAPPIFVAAATDDNLGLAPESVALYQLWTSAHKSAELHMFARGGHGFGIRKHNIPTDDWPNLFAAWLQLQGFLSK